MDTDERSGAGPDMEGTMREFGRAMGAARRSEIGCDVECEPEGMREREWLEVSVLAL